MKPTQTLKGRPYGKSLIGGVELTVTRNTYTDIIYESFTSLSAKPAFSPAQKLKAHAEVYYEDVICRSYGAKPYGSAVKIISSYLN